MSRQTTHNVRFKPTGLCNDGTDVQTNFKQKCAPEAKAKSKQHDSPLIHLDKLCKKYQLELINELKKLPVPEGLTFEIKFISQNYEANKLTELKSNELPLSIIYDTEKGKFPNKTEEFKPIENILRKI